MPKKVLIKKDNLLGVLHKNLELHQKVYKEAAELFHGNYTAELKKMAEKALKENKFQMHVSLNEPANHEDDYNTAIQMIEADCREEIELEFEEFAQFYLNKWGWMASFRMCYMSNVGYSGCSGLTGSTGPAGSKGYSSEATEYFGKEN